MTITRNPVPCWEITPPGEHGSRCFADLAEALLEDDTHAGTVIAERPEPCLVASCRCGEPFIGSESSVSHFASLDEIAGALADDGWVKDGDGGVLCPGCVSGATFA